MRWVPPAHSPLEWRDVIRALRAERTGASVARDAVQRAFRADAVLLCDSGTSALALALEVTASSHPGAIAIPAYACFDIATALGRSVGDVIPYDVNPRTLGPDSASLGRALLAGAKRVVVAPLYGVPLEWDALHAQCAGAGAFVVEDAAQGSGASWCGLPHGALGELSVLSFGRGKGRAAGGGGALLARGARMCGALRDAERLVLRARENHIGIASRIAAQIALSPPARFGIVAGVPALGVGETRLREPRAARAMSCAHMVLVSEALAREAAEIAVRTATAERWIRSLPPSLRTPDVPDSGQAGYLRFPVLRAQAQSLSSDERRLGIGASYPMVLADLGVIADRLPRGYREPLNGARSLVARLVTLPTHSLLEERDKVAITRWLSAQR